MGSYIRRAALQPWYHKPKPRCVARTWKDTEQCTNSASYVTILSGQVIYFCKLHRDMADFKMTLIADEKIDIREL
jgi:hypothetical protein